MSESSSFHPLVSVVIPVFNEREFVLEIIRRVKEEPCRKEIIVVDDCSTDGTRDLLQKIDDENVNVYFHERNQ
jgi:glycosyltransferase involved in cell wall biosynthesis